MLQLTINEKGGPTRTETFDKEEVTIGRVMGNDVVLSKGNISKRHSRILFQDGKLVIQDLKSTNGTYVNGKKISGPHVIKASDKVYIGDFTLQVEREMEEVQASPRRDSSVGRGEEIDMFGGGDGFGSGAPPGGAGLIDDNFDRDFESSPRQASYSGASPEVDFEPEDDGIDAAFADGPALGFDNDFGQPQVPSEEPPPRMATPPRPVSESDGPRRPRSVSVVPVLSEQPEEEPAPPTELPAAPVVVPSAIASAPTVVATGVEPWDETELLHHVQRSLHDALSLTSRRPIELAGLRASAETVAESVLASLQAFWPPGLDSSSILRQAVGRTVDVGDLAELLVDDGVFEVVVTSSGQVMVDREGRLEPSGLDPMPEQRRLFAAHTLASLAGIHPECIEGTLSVRMRDGARLLAALPPHAYRGPSFSVRKTTRDFVTLENLCEYETLDDSMVQILDATVRYRKGILLSIGPGVSGTATLNALVARVPQEERIVAAERGIELHFQGHLHAMGFDLSSGSDMSEAVRFAEHAQADRFVAGELAKSDIEALFSTAGLRLNLAAAAISSDSCEDAVKRLESWIAGPDGDVAEAREALSRAFSLVVHEHRFPDESRRLTSVMELTYSETELSLVPLFHYQDGFETSGRLPSYIERPRAPTNEETAPAEV